MANIFSIQITSPKVTLDPMGKGVATFEVTNTGTETLQGQAEVRTDKTGIDAWFTVTPAVHEYPVGVSTEVKIELAVPPEASPGSYQFALDLVRPGPEIKNERTDQGPWVSFGLKGGINWLRWAIIGGAVLLVVIIAVVVILLTSKVPVPDISGNDRSQAATALAKAGLAPGTISNAASDSVAEGLALGSTPGARTSVPRKSTVDMVFSGGKALVVVPDLKGLTKDQALATLTAMGLVLNSAGNAYDANIPSGSVVASTPGAGSSVPPGSPVDLVISKGTPVPITGAAQAAPAEDTFVYPSIFRCNTIKQWDIPTRNVPIFPDRKFREPFTLSRCPDAKSPELVLENDVSQNTFYPGLVMMRFEFPQISNTAILTAALQVNVASFNSDTTDMTLYISAATNMWRVGSTAPVCSAQRTAQIKMSAPGKYTFDLKPLVTQGQSILKYGLCLQSDSIGQVNLVSGEGGVASQRPMLSVTYYK